MKTFIVSLTGKEVRKLLRHWDWRVSGKHFSQPSIDSTLKSQMSRPCEVWHYLQELIRAKE